MLSKPRHVLFASLAAVLVATVLLGGWVRQPEPPPVVEPVEPEPLPPLEPDTVTIEVDVRPGATLGGLLGQRGLPVGPIREAALELYDLANIRPDRELALVYRDGERDPVALRYAIDGDNTLLVERGEAGWSARLHSIEYTIAPEAIAFTITSSLWDAALGAGLRAEDLPRLAGIFEYELDFNTEIREGAEFSLVADVGRAEGRPPKLDTLHAVRIGNAGKEHVAVRFDLDEKETWFHPDGTSMKRPFLRSPLEFSRVTSGFNPKRFHPILKTARPHNGTDFGAPTGTPVRAVGDGKVVYAGKNGGHGNYVKLDHGNGYHTSYSHLSRIRVKNGTRVKQGQRIGDVGSTGMSTGPHLHYQMWKGGKFVDPLRVALPKTAPLPANRKAEFEEVARTWLPELPGYVAKESGAAEP